MSDTIKELIADADALTYINSLKASITELKEEISTIEQMIEYQVTALKRVKTIARRVDNQYRAIVKAANHIPTPDDSIPVEPLVSLNDYREKGEINE